MRVSPAPARRPTVDVVTSDPTAVTSQPLVASYDGVVCDLDGVVYRGDEAVPGAVDTLGMVVADGVSLVFATNNASRAPDVVAAHLVDLGLDAAGWSVVTSSQAAAAHLAGRLAPGTRVCAVGGPGVAAALVEAGLAPVSAAEVADAAADQHGEPVAAVVQGLGVDVTWSDLTEVGHLVRAGATWVATNLDPMLPTSRGPAPGNGALVAAVRATTDVRPHVVGKPGADLFALSRARLGSAPERTLVCGDRLDTDVEGAHAAGLDSLLVLSGASRLRDLAFATGGARPTYVARDLAGLVAPALRLAPAPGDAVLVDHDGVPRVRTASPEDALRGLVCAAWDARDRGRPVSADSGLWAELEGRVSGPG